MPALYWHGPPKDDGTLVLRNRQVSVDCEGVSKLITTADRVVVGVPSRVPRGPHGNPAALKLGCWADTPAAAGPSASMLASSAAPARSVPNRRIAVPPVFASRAHGTPLRTGSSMIVAYEHVAF